MVSKEAGRVGEPENVADALGILHEAIGEPATARHLQILFAVAECNLNTAYRLKDALGLSAAAVHRAAGRLADGYLDGRNVRQPGAGLVERKWFLITLFPQPSRCGTYHEH
jgi:hypothetical protein